MKLVSRGDTTVVDAYLSPILRRYVDEVAAELPGVRLLFMQSNGGLADARRFQGKDSILSGPAGGVVGAVRTTLAAGYDRIIGFDTGGTSTDVSHYACEFERAFETLVAVVRVRIAIDRARRSATLDFTGSSPQLANNFNAPAAVTMAAVLYVFRTLVDDDIPLNSGCLKPLEVIVPEGSMLRPRYPAAVVAGNVETSQAITDTLYGALGVMAAAQGTMNNFTFGNERYQYYETICGGSGAGRSNAADGGSAGFPGTDAVHTHMTNTRLTDPEVLEWRFPVLLESFSIRRGSGGAGRWRGGDGVVRRVRFLEPMTAAILSGHRRVPPYGMAGGLPGAVGCNFVERADGSRLELGGADKAQMNAGDVFVIETPGGGGYGPPA
jgi:5-oxoprolinase (ATP-hydrolysing)